MAGAVPRRPRVLVTGFGPFPGAPENPTEALIGALGAASGLADCADLRMEVLPVEYEAVPQRLAVLGRTFAPEIAVHFGLSARARGFVLERVARNEIRAEKPDNSGEWPPGGPIRHGAADLPATLPLQAVHDALAAAGLPVEWSEDAGGYLCNYLFYLSCDHSCAGFAPAMSGFIHVPPLGAPMTLDELAGGAAIAIRTCAGRWASAGSADA